MRQCYVVHDDCGQVLQTGICSAAQCAAKVKMHAGDGHQMIEVDRHHRPDDIVVDLATGTVIAKRLS
jgi:spermidine synthase